MINLGTWLPLGARQVLTQNFATAAAGYFFNGGSTTADSFQLDTAGELDH